MILSLTTSFLRPTFFAVLIACNIAAGHLSSAYGQATEADAPQLGVIEAGQDRPSDADIRARIVGIFDEIQELSTIDARVRSGVVTLTGNVSDFAVAERAEEIATRVEGVVAVRNELTETVSVSERIFPAAQRFEDRLWQAVDYLPLLSVAVLVFAVIGFAGFWIAARDWPWARIAPNAFIADFIRQFVRLGFVALGLVACLDVLGASAAIGTIAGAAGIVGLAVGFAVRDTVENYIASILLSLRQPFRPNDHVLIEGQEGRVVRLTSRATILLSLDGNHIRIPNATVFKGILVNFTRNPERRFEFELGIDADSDPAEAVALSLAKLKSLDFVLDDPPPDAWVKDVGDSNIIIWIAGWIDQRQADYNRARSEAIRITKITLEAEGFALPEPIYRLRIEQAGAARLEEIDPQEPDELATTGKAEDAEMAQDTRPDDTVARMVKSDRTKIQRQDLLDESAPTELD